MSVTRSGNSAHDTACNLSEMTRQSAVAAAAGNQATVRAAEIAQPGVFIRALQDLGTGGG